MHIARAGIKPARKSASGPNADIKQRQLTTHSGTCRTSKVVVQN